MPVDEALLEEHASHLDERLRINETFVRLNAGPGRTWGVLSTPLGEPRSLGWVVCHSFGLEQVDLHLTDVALARALASAGYPSLRFHCQGYGDSDDVSTPPGPASHVRDTLHVMSQLPGLASVGSVGLLGSRFGATVAALAADRGAASHLLLVSPVVSGSKYFLELLRSRVITELITDDAGRAVTIEQLKRDLAQQGMVNIKGWPLHRDVQLELQQVDLLRQLERFSGRVLLLQVSRSEGVRGGLARLAARFEQLGARADTEAVTHVAAPNFGYEHFRPMGKDYLGDITEGINQALAERAVSWLARDDERPPVVEGASGR